MSFPSGGQSAEVLHPGEDALDLPSPAITPEGALVLRGALAVGTIGRDHLDAVLPHLRVQRVRVVGFISDQPRGKLVEEASCQNSFHKPALGRRSAFDRDGDRKTVARGDSDDLGPLAPLGRADCEAPFFALANVASTNASSRFSLPRSRSCRASRCSVSTNFPSRIHCWNRRWQVWYGGYFRGSSDHCAPVPSIHNTPFNTARVSCHGRPRLSPRRAGRSTGSTNSHCSSVSSQRPAIAARGNALSLPSFADFRLENVYEMSSKLPREQMVTKQAA